MVDEAVPEQELEASVGSFSDAQAYECQIWCGQEWNLLHDHYGCVDQVLQGSRMPCDSAGTCGDNWCSSSQLVTTQVHEGRSFQHLLP